MLADIPILIGENINFYVPLLKEIVGVSESEYNKLLSILLINKDIIPDLKDNADVSNMEIAYINCYHNADFWENFKMASRMFFKDEQDIKMSPEEIGLFFYFGDIGENNDIGKIKKIDNHSFDYVQKLIMVANNITVDKTEEYSPANEQAAKIIREMQERKKKKPKLPKIMNLHSMISGLAWKQNDINILNIFDLSIYRFYDGFFTTQNIDSYMFTFTGIYTGNIDGQKIDYSKIHWANITENNKEEV